MSPFRLIPLIALNIFVGSVAAVDVGSQTIKQWEYVDFTLDNPSWSGNPFELEATALATHSDGSSKTLRLFYDGGTTWKLRFLGSKRGNWTFVTSSDDADLHGHTGSVTVHNQDNPAIKGLVKPHRLNPKKWARQIDETTDEAFVPQWLMMRNVGMWYQSPEVEADYLISTFGDQFNGFNLHCPLNWWDATASPEDGRASGNPDINADPDLESFRAMETLLTRLHQEGKVLHFWFQSEGDYRMHWPCMQRLMPYIAARLAPIPNWTMGLGFDGAEVNGNQNTGLGEWRDACNDHTPYKHIFGQRRATTGDYVDYHSWEDSRWYTINYETFLSHYQALTTKPGSSEDRFRIRDFGAHKNVTETLTRRNLYYTTFAGGLSAIWGNLMREDAVLGGSYFGTVDQTRDAGQPYFHKDWYATYETAIHGKGRFLHDLEPAPQVGNEMVLASADGQHVLHYEEDVSEITLRLPQLSGQQPVVAINTVDRYAEIALGSFSAGTYTIELPGFSDWLIAVGQFPGDESDTQAPQLIDVIIAPGLESIYAVFDESISAATMSQFTLNGGSIIQVARDRDPRRARIRVSGLSLNSTISLSANNIEDFAGNRASNQSRNAVVGAAPKAFTFSDADIHGWKAIDIEPSDPDAHREQGTWIAQPDGSLRCVNVRNHDSYLVLSDAAASQWHSYALVCDVAGRQVQRVHGSTFEFIVGYEDLDNYHALRYREFKENPTATIDFIEVNEGSTTVLASANLPEIGRNNAQALRLEMRPGEVYADFGGEDIFNGTIATPSLRAGAPALRHLRTGGRVFLLNNLTLEYLEPTSGGGGGGTAPTITLAEASPATVSGITTQLRALATEPDGDAINFTWEVSQKPAGSNPTSGTGAEPTVTFDQAGIYRFQITASDKDGIDTDTIEVTVEQTVQNLEINP